MIKQGVDLRGLKPQMVLAYTIACGIYADRVKDCVITSASDGVHGPNSLHYQGLALDIRTNTLGEATAKIVCQELKLALGDQFDVVLEHDHLHIEWDVKESDKPAEV